MSTRPFALLAGWRHAAVAALRTRNWTRAGAASLGRRLAYFWIVWSALLLVHEGGHALAAREQGQIVRRVTVGVGPELWRGRPGGTELVVRLVPIAGMTTLRSPEGASAAAHGAVDGGRWAAWGHQVVTLGGGILATIALALSVAALIALRERTTGRRWIFGRLLIADAVVLTVFNFLPVPPLDGGRALLGALAAWRGSPLTGDALFWVQAGGLALAVVPMTLWTRWTARIDAAADWWWAPGTGRAPSAAEPDGIVEPR